MLKTFPAFGNSHYQSKFRFVLILVDIAFPKMYRNRSFPMDKTNQNKITTHSSVLKYRGNNSNN